MAKQRKVDSGTIEYPTPGDVLDGRYRLEGILNAGGMGVIMRARQLNMDRDVAVKLLLPDKVDREATKARFEREVHLAKQLTHPNIIRFYDYGRHGRFLYIVMELLEGSDLKELLRAEGPFSVARALDITIQAADALTDAHQRNIVHRDLKPGNFFIQRLGSNRDFIKLLDFGIAKSLDSREFDVTSTGEVSGTVAYLGPEIAHGKTPDKTTDVYALAVVLVQMVTGRKIFEGTSVAETLMNHMQKPVLLPPTLANSSLAPVIEKALSKNPQARYQNAGELLQALNAIVHTVSPSMRVSAAEIEQTYGPPTPGGGVTNSSEVVRDPHTPASTKVGYAVADIRSDSQTELVPASALPDGGEGMQENGGAPRWVSIVAGLTLIVVGAFAGIWVMDNLRREDPTEVATPVQPPPAEPTVTSIRLSTSPAGATVVRDGKELGVTPLEVDLESAAEFTFTLEGHEPRTETVDPAESTALDLAMSPVPAPDMGVFDAGANAGATDAGVDAAGDPEQVGAAANTRDNSGRDRDRRRPRKDRTRASDDDKSSDEDESFDVFGMVPEDEKKKKAEAEPDEAEEPAEKTGAELHAEAKQAFIKGDYRGCVTACQKALGKGVSDCHSLLANAYRQLGQTENSCRHYKAAGIAHKSCMTLQSR